MTIKASFLGLVIFSLISFSSLQAQDTEGQDHPLISRFENSTIIKYKQNDFMGFEFALGTPNDYKSFSKSAKKEGKLTQIAYELTSNSSSALEVYRNYESTLKKSGANILFSCIDGDCKGKDDYHIMNPYIEKSSLIVSHETQRFGYLAATFSKDGSTYYFALVVGQFNDYVRYELVILEETDMTNDKVTVQNLKDNLLSQGKVALYGVLFDTGKATLKPESTATLQTIAKFMKENPSINIFVVGHTDLTGNYNDNIELSKQRAKAVVQALTASYGIAENRLMPEGVGPLVPVATNRNEKGKKKNRRVELVIRS